MPITTSILPLATPSTTSASSLAVRKRESCATFTGKPAKRSLKVWACCWARIVVGTRTATCLESWTALKAARTAISVLPYPTSPQTSRSIGTARSMSAFTSSIARAWSGVSR